MKPEKFWTKYKEQLFYNLGRVKSTNHGTK